ncbi:MAG: hypothetical protein PHN82_08610 [bacterium]|nr:hypothetical protein [bacterium]
MSTFRIYAELSFKADLALPGVDETTMDYEVRQRKGEVYEYLQRRIADAFPDATDRTLHYFEFSLIR